MAICSKSSKMESMVSSSKGSSGAGEEEMALMADIRGFDLVWEDEYGLDRMEVREEPPEREL